MSRSNRSHTPVFRQMQMLLRLARLKEQNPKAYDRAMEELMGGRERETDKSRRQFLKTSAGAAVGALGLEALESFQKKAYGQSRRSDTTYKVVVVGAGIAGLNCAWQLRKIAPLLARDRIKLDVQLYEARERAGGRMLTSIGDVAKNMHCELGAEFVDSSNHDMFRLVQDPELSAICQSTFHHPLAMLDTANDPTGTQNGKGLIAQHLVIEDGNQQLHMTIDQASDEMQKFVRKSMTPLKGLENKCKAFRPFSGNSCGGTGNFAHDNAGQPSGIKNDRTLVELDNMSISQYLGAGKQGSSIEPLRLDPTKWISKYLETAYVTEYGLDLQHQSAMSLVSLFGDQDEDQAGKIESVDVFGPSNERFKVFGGNDKVVRCLAIGLRNQIHYKQRLTSIKKESNQYALSFEGAGIPVKADFVVLACPFTMLSTVKELKGKANPRLYPRFRRLNPGEWDYQPNFKAPADLSDVIAEGSTKANAIDYVGYGRNFKLMAGMDRPIWREQQNGRWGGYTFSNRQFQMGWDSGQCQSHPDIPVATFVEGQDPKHTGFVKNALDGRLSTVAEGFQFSWFRGGNPASENIIKDTSRFGIVSHTYDDGATNSAQHLQRNQFLGVMGEGKTRYSAAEFARVNAIMHQIMTGVINDTGHVYSGFVEANQRQGARLGRPAHTSYLWANDPFVKASYIAYHVGQWTTISGIEGAPVGFDGKLRTWRERNEWTMFFAGEHCSGEFQGFMNGGAQTGRLAAVRLLHTLKARHSADTSFIVPASELAKLEPARRQFFVTGLEKVFG